MLIIVPYYKFIKMVIRSRFYRKRIINNTDGAVAQLARAPALQAGGQEFDSPQLHHKEIRNIAKYLFFLESTLKNI